MSAAKQHGRVPFKMVLLSAFFAFAAPVASAPMPVAPASEAAQLIAAEIAPTEARYGRTHGVRHSQMRHRRHRSHGHVRYSRMHRHHRPRYYNPGYDPGYDTGYEPDYAPVYRPPLVYSPEPGYGYEHRFRRHHQRWGDAGPPDDRDWQTGDQGRSRHRWRRDETPVSQPPQAYRPPAYRQSDRVVGEPRRRFDQGDGARYPVQQRQGVIVQQPRRDQGPRFTAQPRAIERQDAPRQLIEAPRHAPGNCAPGQNCGVPR